MLGNYGLGLQANGAADFVAQYTSSGDLYELILSIIDTMPGSAFIFVLTLVCMAAFYTTSFDFIAYTAAYYSYKKLDAKDKPHTLITFLWCVLFLLCCPLHWCFRKAA